MSTLVVDGGSVLHGEVKAPSSKSFTHRAAIAASLAKGASTIHRPLRSEDIAATVDACKAFGAEIRLSGEAWAVRGADRIRLPTREVHCRMSASTIRFMTPISALAEGTVTLTGSSSLLTRPMEPLIEALHQLGVDCRSRDEDGRLPIVVEGKGRIPGGYAEMRGDVSSQFVSGLLFACPLAEEDTELKLTTPLESSPYVRMTLSVLSEFNVEVEHSSDMRLYAIPSGQSYTPTDFTVPGDYSSAAFMMVSAVITGSEITVANLRYPSTQGDAAIITILRRMGIPVDVEDGSVTVRADVPRPVRVNAADTPDLVPACAVLGCYADGTTEIYNAERLRFKESDRLAALSTELSKMGADITVSGTSLTIKGGSPLTGAVINPHNDHRIAMACATAALAAKGKTCIQDPECIKKSYPNFVRDLKRLGAKMDVR